MDAWFSGSITTKMELNLLLVEAIDPESGDLMEPHKSLCLEGIFPPGFPVTLLFVDERNKILQGMAAQVVLSTMTQVDGKPAVKYDLAVVAGEQLFYRVIMRDVYADHIPLDDNGDGEKGVGLVSRGQLALVAEAQSTKNKKAHLSLVPKE